MWKASYAIGVDRIDHQHQELFKAVAKLLNTIKNTKSYDRDAIKEIILFLKDYTINHFNDEEAYQQSINYINYKAHKKIHQDLNENLISFEEKLISEDYSQESVLIFADFIIAWLVSHVGGDDQLIAGRQLDDNFENNKALRREIENGLNYINQ